MIPDNVQVSTLSNGLTLITINQPWNQGIYCMAYVKVGSCDEQLPRDKGICHFIEHMVFRGTEDYTKDEMTKLVIGRGGYFNAATSYTYTKYHMWTQPEYLGDTLSILDNMIFKPLINVEDLNIEREVIIEEAMERNSDPTNQALLKADEYLYPNHNYKYPIIGTEESINNITPTRMREYIRGYYRPQTIILVLCGNLPEQSELEDVLYNNAHGFIRKTRASNSAVLDRNFGSFELLSESIENSEVWEDVKSSVSITSLAFDATDMYKKEKCALDVLTTALGGNLNSILFKEIRDKLGLCYSCGSYGTILADHLGNYGIYLMSRKSKMAEAEEKLDKILKSIAGGKLSEEDVSEAKNSIIGTHMRQIESGNSLATMIGQSHLLDNEQYRILPWEYSDLIKKVNKKQVVEMAHKIFTKPYSRYRIFNKE